MRQGYRAIRLVACCWALWGTGPAIGEEHLPQREQTVLVVVGAAGDDQYATLFTEWAEQWRTAAEKGGAKFLAIGLQPHDTTDRELLATTLRDLATSHPHPLWLVFLGHGTFDGKTAKFNLRGPDVSAHELAEWLEPREGPLAVINSASSSGPFLQALSLPGRVVVTSTRSGHESNFARFGGYLAAAINDPAADLDKDDQVSLLEAYLTASRRVAEFYDTDARLATEHALLDDNGDRLGTPAEWFRGVRATRQAQQGGMLDGTLAHQWHLVASQREARMTTAARSERDRLEREIEELRQRKSQMAQTDYYDALEKLLLPLARIYVWEDPEGEEPEGEVPEGGETPPGE